MGENYDLCSGRDGRGRRWQTVLPAGVVRTGMFVRLVGGIFMLVEKVENCAPISREVQVSSAAQVLESVWEGRFYG